MGADGYLNDSGTINGDRVELAVSLIEGSKEVSQLEHSLRRSTGRPRALSVKAILAALVLLALGDRPLILKSVTEVLYFQLGNRQKERLGVQGQVKDHAEFPAAYRRVRYLFHLICGEVDPSPLPKNLCVGNEIFSARAKPIAEAESSAKAASLFRLCNSLLEQSVKLMGPDELKSYDGSIGLDATPVPLFSRGPSKTKGICASDPDGGWYVREGDHRDSEDNKGRRKTKVAWALEATIATMAQLRDETGPTHPNLAIGLTMSKPGIDPGGMGIKVLASIAKRGYKTGYVGADRAYSTANPDNFHLPLKALGYSLVMDYRIDQLGRQMSSGGALLVEGGWYCPKMPEPLIDATVELRNGKIDRNGYQEHIAAREKYALRRKQGPDQDGYERYSCPAVGKYPKVMCSFRPGSASQRDGRIKVTGSEEELRPPICCQGAITIAVDVGVRHRQELRFATSEWHQRYATLRNSIEGLNGYLKDPCHEALSQPGRRRVRGIAPQSIFVTVLLMAANVRKINSFREDLARRQKPPRPKRRRTTIAAYA